MRAEGFVRANVAAVYKRPKMYTQMTPSKRTKTNYDDANKSLGAESEDIISSFGTVDHIASSYDFEDDNPDDEAFNEETQNGEYKWERKKKENKCRKVWISIRGKI